jgi:hypothetical protein
MAGGSCLVTDGAIQWLTEPFGDWQFYTPDSTKINFVGILIEIYFDFRQNF